MKTHLKTATLALAALGFGTTLALADPIEGKWRTGDGVLVKISKCGGSFCVDVMEGEFKGKRSGKLQKKGDAYSGTLKQFSTGISFSGSAKVAGSTIKLVAKKFGVTVKRDTWTKG